MRKLITLMIMVLCAATLLAQVPEKFSYQAVVRNTTNQLVTNASVSVRVSILQGSADGSAVYVETHNATTNTNGLLTVEIGGGKAEQGEFAGIDWANGPYFLKTETDPNGGSDYGVTITQQLLSVPYALYAKEAANGFSGDYNDLKNKPAIPQNVGELTNDAGYITLNDIPAAPKGGGANDAGIIQTTTCGEIDLCELANQLTQLRGALSPKVTTNAVTYVIGRTTAICGGVVTDSGYDAVFWRGVCWGTQPNPTRADSHTYDGYGTGEFTSTLSDLQPNTTYYVRAYATNSVGTSYGNELSFTTADTCAAITLPYSEDFENYTTSTTASTGVQPLCWVLEQEDVAMTDANRPQLYYKSEFAHSGNYSLKLYNRCVYAMPKLSEDIPMNRVQLEMYLRQANAAYQLEVGVWEDNGTFVPVATFNNSTTGVTRVECDFSTYTGSGRHIAFRNVLGNGANYAYSTNYLDDITLDTLLNGNTTATLPTVTTGTVRSITTTTATGGGNVTADGGADVTGRGVCWSTEPNPTVESNHTNDGTGMGTFTSAITGLTQGTTYYLRAYATNSVGTAYGEEVSFTTVAELQDTCATISLPYFEDFESYTTSTTAATGVQPDCWKLVREDVAMTDANRPQLYYKSDFAHSGSYSLKLYNRGVYAMPALSDSVNLNNVRLEMYLRQANARYELQVGIWEDNGTFVPVATFNNSTTDVKFVACSFVNYHGSGRRIAFRNTLGSGSNLNYSTNYLDDIVLKSIVDEKSCPGTPTVTDHEGNVYATVQIGQQCWMRENLRTTTSPSTGTYLVLPFTSSTYTGKQAFWPNHDSATCVLQNYGLLYNWNAAVDTFNTAFGETSINDIGSNAVPASFSGHRRGICPQGWHLPSDVEWTTMIDYVKTNGSSYRCGDNSNNIAKAFASTEGWRFSHTICAVGNNPTDNNALGFSAIPVRAIHSGEEEGSCTYFWASTFCHYEPDYDVSFARDVGLHYTSPQVQSSGCAQIWTDNSVRCLRD